ncbi:MAG: ferritin-like domain-containing protein [Planctomycetaceae bacterium]
MPKPTTSAKLSHPPLVDLLRTAYSAEKAAAFAYIGHARSVREHQQKSAIRQIEADEWDHRRQVLNIMQTYGVPISRWYEIKFHVIGRFISACCHVIGWFMPFYFAGRLESGNVCEYFRMMQYFEELGITDHHAVLYEMGIKEKEHEEYFRAGVRNHRLLPLFERLFGWGDQQSFNDVDLNAKYPVEKSKAYCRKNA